MGRHDLEQMCERARQDRFGVHEAVDEPAAADVILFVETHAGAGHYFQLVRGHPVYREFHERCYLFCSDDRIVPFVPGVFASVEARWHAPAWTRSGPYIDVRETDGLYFEPGRAPSRLFSFVGATSNHRLRRRVMALRHPDGLILDVSAQSLAVEERRRSPAMQTEWRRRYAQSIHESAFVLCPRGAGASSRRIFEAMMLGRVPVIVSDQWVPPRGPEWESFSLRVAERDVPRIPGMLEERAPDAAGMGALARAEWLDWFSEEACFHRTVGWCLELAEASPSRGGVRRHLPHLQMLRPYHAARAVAKRISHR
jgi:hypothetical protein